MRNRKLSWILLGLSFLSVLGCDGPTEPGYCGATNPSGFKVLVGDEVTFTWADCLVTGLVVYGDGLQLWGIGGHFRSPVTYGIVPAGASSLGDAGLLESGHTYDVLLVSGSWAGWYDFER